MRRSSLAFAAVVLVLGPAPALADDTGAHEYSHANDRFGQALALDGDRLAVGVAGSNAGGFDAGLVHIYVHEHGEWRLEAQLHNPGDEPAGGHFGRAVALVGDTLVVGTTIEDGFAGHVDERRGAVHVFTRRRGEWQLQASLVDPETDSDSFGHAVALAGDTLAVANDWRIRDRSLLPSQVHMFRRSGDSWDEQARIDLPEDNVREFALGDGTLLVSNHFEIDAYRRDGAAWREDPSLTLDIDVRGLAVDRDTALVVSDDDEPGIFVYHDHDGAWSLEAELELDPDGEEMPGSPGTAALGADWAAVEFGHYDDNKLSTRIALWQRRDGAWHYFDDGATSPDLEAFDAKLAINSRWLAVGYPHAGEPQFEQSGEVSVYAKAAGLPEVARLSPDDTLAGCGCRTGGRAFGPLAVLFALGRRRRRHR